MSDILETLGSHEKLATLYRWWDALRGERPMPARSDLDPVELKDWLGNLNLVRIEGDPPSFTYAVFGTNLALHLGEELTGRPVDDHRAGAVVIESYREVWTTGRPLVRHHDLGSFSGYFRHLRLLLPFGSDGVVTHVIAGAYPLAHPAGASAQARASV